MSKIKCMVNDLTKLDILLQCKLHSPMQKTQIFIFQYATTKECLGCDCVQFMLDNKIQKYSYV